MKRVLGKVRMNLPKYLSNMKEAMGEAYFDRSYIDLYKKTLTEIAMLKTKEDAVKYLRQCVNEFYEPAKYFKVINVRINKVKFVQGFYDELLENNYDLDVIIFKSFYRNLIRFGVGKFKSGHWKIDKKLLNENTHIYLK